MKIILSTLLLFVTFATFSQTEPDIYIEEDLVGYKDQGIDSYAKELKDKNREKALSVVAPMDEAIARVIESKKLPDSEPGSIDAMLANAKRKVKMVEYSDVSFEDTHTKNEDGTWSPKEKYISKEENEPIAEKPYEHKEMESIGILSKIFTIIILIILWFAIGFVINFIIYNNRPDSELGTSSLARFLHMATNIALAIMILVTLSR